MNLFIYSLQGGSFGTVQASGLAICGQGRRETQSALPVGWGDMPPSHSSETALHMGLLMNVQAYRELEKTMLLIKEPLTMSGEFLQL